ncbi:MAG: class I SAM-dependent methyltransferase [Calditrichia bacterium]
MWRLILPVFFALLVFVACNNHNAENHYAEGEHSEAHGEHDGDLSDEHDGDPADEHDGHNHNHDDDANAHMHKTPFEELVKRFEEPGRDDWQQPKKVVAMMGNLAGKTVADIGVGTGFFAFPLAEAGAKVIAIDIDQRFLDYVDAKKNKMESQPAIELRLAKEDDPLLKKDEADHAIIVNTYHHIHNRKAYFAGVRNDLKEGGSLWVVDFRKKELPMGPPVEMKMSAETVEKELLAAGYSKVTIDRSSLAYQYIVVAEK